MADTEKKFSELVNAGVFDGTEIMAMSQTNVGTLLSVKATLQAIANWFAVNSQYASALDTTSKTVCGAINELKQLISVIPQFSIEVVQTLPTEDISETTIYMTPSQNPQTQDAYDEFIYVNNAWEHVGSTAVDLSAYYTKLEVDGLLAVKANTADVTAALSTKADQTGTYAGFTSGKAQTVQVPVPSSVGTKSNPYMRRQIPYNTAEVETMSLVGATVNGNQLVQNGNFESTSGWSSAQGSFSVSNNECEFTTSGRYGQLIRTSFNFIAGHTYLLCMDAKSNDLLTISMGGPAFSPAHKYTQTTASYSRYYRIIPASIEHNNFVITTDTGGDGKKYTIKNVNVIDLTAYFGSTEIPDKAYTMEQTESGSGVAWLKSQGFFNEDYIAYRANGLESVRAEEKVNVGFNQWDGTKFDGYYINSNGVKTSAPSTLNCSCTDFIKVIPNTQYYFKGYVGGSTGIYAVTYYDENKTFLSKSNGNATAPFTFTTPVNCCFIACNVKNDLFNTFCINISSPENGKYEPYHAETISFDTSKTLRGLYTIDGDNIKAVGDIYKASGEITRNYKTITFDGSSDESWAMSSSGLFTLDTIADYKKTSNTVTCINNLLDTIPNVIASSALADKDNCVTLYAGEQVIKRLYVKISSITTLAGFTTYLSNNNMELTYEVETPSTESATPFTAIQSIDGNGTEEFTDYGVESGDRDFMVPPGNESNYYAYTDGSMVIPAIPPADGDYEMKLHVSGGVRTFTWE